MGYTTASAREVDVVLLRNRQSLAELKTIWEDGSADKQLRSYFLPGYQLSAIDMIKRESGLSKGAVVRSIIDEWIEQRLGENGQQ